MFLTASNLVHYLTARGIISTASVVDADFSVLEAGRRNRNYKVIRQKEPGLFIKQVQSNDPMAVSTLQREAAYYRLTQDNSILQNLKDLMPDFIAHDPARHILITKLLPFSENLNEYYAGQNKFPVEIANLIGKILGEYHSVLRKGSLSQADMSNFPRQPPWILSLHHSYPQMKNTLSGGSSQLAQLILQYPQFHYNLDRLKNNWRYDSIIHGDIKWDNCMVYKGENDEVHLKIIDWELVDYGDAAWDVGSVLQAYLTSWIFSMPLSSGAFPQVMIEKAGYQLEDMFPAIRAFWNTYCEAVNIPSQQRSLYLLRCVEYGAARMIQTAFEYLHYSPVMTNHGATLLQVSQNILTNPQEAAKELLSL